MDSHAAVEDDEVYRAKARSEICLKTQEPFAKLSKVDDFIPQKG